MNQNKEAFSIFYFIQSQIICYHGSTGDFVIVGGGVSKALETVKTNMVLRASMDPCL